MTAYLRYVKLCCSKFRSVQSSISERVLGVQQIFIIRNSIRNLETAEMQGQRCGDVVEEAETSFLFLKTIVFLWLSKHKELSRSVCLSVRHTIQPHRP